MDRDDEHYIDHSDFESYRILNENKFDQRSLNFEKL